MRGQALKSLVESMFEVIRDRSTADELMIVCPVPGCGDQTGNRGVNLKNGLTGCFRCNTGGDFIRWARWLGYAFDDNDTASLTLDELYRLLDPPRPKAIVPVINEIALPKGFHTCYDYRESAFTRQIESMAIRKNLELDDLVQAGVGYVTEDPRWEPFAVFPVMEYGRLVYFQGRTYWDEPGMSTKKFPNRQEAPLSSKYWLFDIDELGKDGVDTVVIVESILNVLSLKKKFAELGVTNMIPVCVFKHAVSKPQFYKLLRFKNLNEAILLFDFDAIDLSWRDAKRIDDHIKVSIAEMPVSETNSKLDPNDDVEAAWVSIQNRKPYTMCGKLSRDLITTEERYFLNDRRGTYWDLKNAPVSTIDTCSEIRSL